jgi:hypothetical protein
MDNEEFKRRLSEVADWKLPDTPRETSLNQKKKRGRKSAEDVYQETREEIFFEEFGGVNPTYPPMLLKVKRQPTVCECGRVCEHGCEKEAKLYETKTKNHWKVKCKTCGMTQDPYTGEFNLNAQKASVVWHSFLRETKGTSQSKGNIAKGLVKSKPTDDSTILENDKEIITFHHGNKPTD